MSRIEWNFDYETVAASQTTQTIGPLGAAGDLLHGLWVVPANTNRGAVAIKDGSGSAITVAAADATAADLTPFFIPLGIISKAGAWQVTTGTNVSVVAIGRFS